MTNAEREKGAAAVAALRRVARWFESPLGRVAAAEARTPAAGPVDEALPALVAAAERAYLETAVARLRGSSPTEAADLVAVRVQTLVLEARLGTLAFDEARRRATELVSDGSLPIPPARRDDLEALVGLLDWYEFAAERSAAK
jgi:hypothetical protein